MKQVKPQPASEQKKRAADVLSRANISSLLDASPIAAPTSPPPHPSSRRDADLNSNRNSNSIMQLNLHTQPQLHILPSPPPTSKSNHSYSTPRPQTSSSLTRPSSSVSQSGSHSARRPTSRASPSPFGSNPTLIPTPNVLPNSLRPTHESLLGHAHRSWLLNRFGEKVNISSLRGKIVGLYFSSAWSLPCRSFTSRLARVYLELAVEAATKPFEIVWVNFEQPPSVAAAVNHLNANGSSNPSDSSSSTNAALTIDSSVGVAQGCPSALPTLSSDSLHMNFGLHIPNTDRLTRRRLVNLFQLKRIPTLVILDERGRVITKNGVGLVVHHGALGYPFKADSVLASATRRIFDHQILELFAHVDRRGKKQIDLNDLEFCLRIGGQLPEPAIRPYATRMLYDLSSPSIAAEQATKSNKTDSPFRGSSTYPSAAVNNHPEANSSQASNPQSRRNSAMFPTAPHASATTVTGGPQNSAGHIAAHSIQVSLVEWKSFFQRSVVQAGGEFPLDGLRALLGMKEYSSNGVTLPPVNTAANPQSADSGDAIAEEADDDIGTGSTPRSSSAPPHAATTPVLSEVENDRAHAQGGYYLAMEEEALREEASYRLQQHELKLREAAQLENARAKAGLEPQVRMSPRSSPKSAAYYTHPPHHATASQQPLRSILKQSPRSSQRFLPPSTSTNASPTAFNYPSTNGSVNSSVTQSSRAASASRRARGAAVTPIVAATTTTAFSAASSAATSVKPTSLRLQFEEVANESPSATYTLSSARRS